MRLIFRTAAVILALTVPCSSARLSAPAQRAFENYAAAVEKRLAQQHSSADTYLATLNVAAADRADLEGQLRSGALHMEPVDGGTREVSGGLVHHWRGVAFFSGAQANDMLALLRDYNHLSTYYAPEVESSRLVSDHQGVATVAMRFKKQMVVTIVLDTEYDVRAGLTALGEGYSVSRSTHIWEIEGAGTSRERRLTEGNDDGFLWRLNTYWSFLEVPGGLLIECEAISLTRDVPAGLGWLVAPVIQDMPRESLKFTLTATQNALSSNARKEARR
ncbi:MAG TPA: hypothetical protein VIH91_05245 [Terriglobales bacterium]